MSLTFETVSKYLKDEAGLNTTAITHDTALFTSSLLDSFSLVDLILFIESETGATIDPDDLKIENFDSIARITHFANSKTESAA